MLTTVCNGGSRLVNDRIIGYNSAQQVNTNSDFVHVSRPFIYPNENTLFSIVNEWPYCYIIDVKIADSNNYMRCYGLNDYAYDFSVERLIEYYVGDLETTEEESQKFEDYIDYIYENFNYTDTYFFGFNVLKNTFVCIPEYQQQTYQYSKLGYNRYMFKSYSYIVGGGLINYNNLDIFCNSKWSSQTCFEYFTSKMDHVHYSDNKEMAYKILLPDGINYGPTFFYNDMYYIDGMYIHGINSKPNTLLSFGQLEYKSKNKLVMIH